MAFGNEPHEDNRRLEEFSKEREKQIKAEYKEMKKKNHPRRRVAKFCFVALIVGVVIGAGAVLWLQNSAPKAADQPDNISVVFERVVKQDELVTASQKYQVVEKVKDANKFFDLFDIPFTENSFWYRYVGTIKMAVDLSSAELVGQDGNTLTIRLHKPYISSNTPDMEESCALEENNNILNPIHIKDVDEYKKDCVEKIEEASKEGDLLNEAEVNAESDLSQLFSISLGGEYQVKIDWVEE